MKIFLIGFMGSGKSSLGRRAARLGDLHFLDLDQEIEKNEGKGIPEIFSGLGEEKFRELEQAKLRSLIGTPGDCVISTGGGTPCFFGNMEEMKVSGATIYLRMSPGRLAARLKNSKEDRPLLQDHGEELSAFVKKLLAEREKFYLQANYILEESLITAQDIAGLFRQIRKDFSEEKDSSGIES